ncbi:protein of unknown function [Methanoculleus bourgensis]|uniref:Uncharacterized protein n=1 Tax=Methanoculleus bourgensis TaxID=83986 RepID=A0A0X3BPT9_9EURY|nr:protein of unknown function [Methanoculleus bourgensis]
MREAARVKKKYFPGQWTVVVITPRVAAGEGLAPLARTFGMETREDTVQFRRRTSVSGTIGRSTGNRPPPRKTVVIPVRACDESPTGSLREVIMPRVSPHTAPTPQGDAHHGPLPGESPGILRIPHPR